MTLSDMQIALCRIECKIECMEKNVSGDFSLCNNDCDNCDLCYAQGNMGEQIDDLKIAIDCIKQQIIKGEKK